MNILINIPELSFYIIRRLYIYGMLQQRTVIQGDVIISDDIQTSGINILIRRCYREQEQLYLFLVRQKKN